MAQKDPRGTATGDGSRLLTVREVAFKLGMSVASIWRLRSAGSLPDAVRIGSSMVRWRESEIDSWVAAGCPALGEHQPTKESRAPRERK